MDAPTCKQLPENARTVRQARKMVRTELLGQHSHTTSNGVQVHVWLRGGTYLARGSFGRRRFGETLGRDAVQASSGLRRLLSAIEDGSFVRPSEADHRPLKAGPVPRLSLAQVANEFLAEKRKLRGRRTCRDYSNRLAPALAFADLPDSRRRWPLAMDLDRTFTVELRAFLFTYLVSRNGRPGAAQRPMAASQVYNVMVTLQSLLTWARRPDVGKLPASFLSPVTSDLVGAKPAKDPLRLVKLPLDRRVELVKVMDAWQLRHLALSLVLPPRPDEMTGLLVSDVDFERGRLQFGTRFGGRDFNKGRQGFVVPFPSELAPLLRDCVGGRLMGPLLRSRAVWEGRRTPAIIVGSLPQLEALYQKALTQAPAGAAENEQDSKDVFRRLLLDAGGVSGDQLAKEFKKLLKLLGWTDALTFYDTRGAVTTDMQHAGVRHLELRYMTGHSTSDILNQYVCLEPEQAMIPYFEKVRPLVVAIMQRARQLL